MKTKIEKVLRYLAAGIFFVALALNVKFTLDSPYFLTGNELVAQTTGTGSDTTGTSSTTNCQPACSAVQVCVNGTCVWRERSTYQSCTTQKYCGFWIGFKSCEGHKYSCQKHPEGITNCSASNCECDEDPC